MASHKELLVEWTMLDGDCNNWTLQDLQLAAELGRTLLERNEELENELKQQQAIIEDQAQEIEFLTKQSSSMKEQSESRVKFYEQLEQTIIELERTNTHLSRENEIDKKRIQSLCENIDYLERKCEEMSRALETIRDERTKRGFHGSRGKVNRGSYFNFGSDSSEEDNMTSGYGFGYGFGFNRRRSHSLQDLRDYTPSPDEFDSGNSNSPDLKTSESEYVESLESRIEELQAARKEGTDKVLELESQIRLLIQENANLQTKLVQMSSEKDQQIVELRRQLLDSGMYSQISFNTSGITATSTRRNSAIGGGAGSSHLDHHEIDPSSISVLSPASPSCSTSSSHPSPRPSSSANHGDVEASSSSAASTTSSTSRNKSHLNHMQILNINTNSNANNSMFMCKRCSAEVSILSLVNSIEVENDGEVNGCYPEFPYNVAGLSADDHDMEFSSLEHELARATGASLPLDTRHSSKKPSPRKSNHSFPLFPRHRTSIFHRDKIARHASTKSEGSESNHELQIECDEELEYDENFELFLGHQPTFTREAERASSSGSSSKQGRRLFIMEESSDTGGCSGSSTHDDEDDDVDLDEEPSLAKDRKPEISRSKKNSGRVASSNKKQSSNGKSSTKSASAGCNSSSGCGLDEESTCAPVIEQEGSEAEHPEEQISVTFASKFHSKLLELPTRIPSDEECEDDFDDFEYDDDFVDGIHAAKTCVPGVSSDAAILFKEHLVMEGSTHQDGELLCENNNDRDETSQNKKPIKKTKCGIQKSLSSSGYESVEERCSMCNIVDDSANENGTDMEKHQDKGNGNEAVTQQENGSNKSTDPNYEEAESVDEKNDSTIAKKMPEGYNEGNEGNPGNETEAGAKELTSSSSKNNKLSTSSIVPEYKQILQNLFNMFNNSKRKYPIPMYPYVNGQSSALKKSLSNNNN